MVATLMGLTMSCCPIHGFFRIVRSSKMKVSLQENGSLNQNRSGPQEFDNLSSYNFSRDNQYKSSTLPPPPPPIRTNKVTNQTSSSSSIINNKIRPISLPSTVTMSTGDDSCAINELLEGRMYLTVILPPELVNVKGSPSGSKVVINVERRTPMMDILVNIATQYKFNASKYRIHVEGYNFKASTPIGSLDVNTVSIVPKPIKPGFRSNLGSSETNLAQPMPSSSVIYSIPSKQRSATLSSPSISFKSNDIYGQSNLNSNHSTSQHQGLPFISNVPFKTTFRLQVNLPRNQLMVLRVSPESTISQIKSKICEEKELDPSKYQLTAKEDKELIVLDPVKCLADYGINEVTLMSNNLLAKVQMEQSTSNLNNANDNKNTNEVQSTVQAAGKLTKAIKKRPAPLPPAKTSAINEQSSSFVKQSSQTDNGTKMNGNVENVDFKEDDRSSSSHMRQDSGSDSSGYHESTVSSESPRPLSHSSVSQLSVLKSQTKSNDKDHSKKGTAIKKRKAPLPPNWKDNIAHEIGEVNGGGSNSSTISNKSEIGESIDCLSDVSVPLSSASGSSHQSNTSDYRIMNGINSSIVSNLPEDEPSFTMLSDDLGDVGTLKGSDSAPIPSPDSGTCSHVPLDEEKMNGGASSTRESTMMDDSSFGDFNERGEIGIDEQETSSSSENQLFDCRKSAKLCMKPLSFSSKSSSHTSDDEKIVDVFNSNEVTFSETKTTPINLSASPISEKHLNDTERSVVEINRHSFDSEIQSVPEEKRASSLNESANATMDRSKYYENEEKFKFVHRSVSVESEELSYDEMRSESTGQGSIDESNSSYDKKVYKRSDTIEDLLSDEQDEVEEPMIRGNKPFTVPSTISSSSSMSPSSLPESKASSQKLFVTTESPTDDRIANDIDNKTDKVLTSAENRDFSCNSKKKEEVSKMKSTDHDRDTGNDKVQDEPINNLENPKVIEEKAVDNVYGSSKHDTNEKVEMIECEEVESKDRLDKVEVAPKVEPSLWNESQDHHVDEIDGPDEENENVSSSFVRDLCRPRVRLTNFKIGSYKNIDNVDIYQNNNADRLTNGYGSNERTKSFDIDTVKPVIVTASLKSGNATSATLGPENKMTNNNNINSNVKPPTESSNKISMITPQPFKLNRLASWSGSDAKSFRQACANGESTIAEKVEKIEKVLRIEKPMDKGNALNHGNINVVDLSTNSANPSNSTGHRCISQIEINGDSDKVSIRNTVTTIKGINSGTDESPIQVTTFVKSDKPLITDYGKGDAIVSQNNDLKRQELKIIDGNPKPIEIIKMIKPLTKVIQSKIEPISSKSNITATKLSDLRSNPKVPVPILPSYIPQAPPPPPPPPLPIISSIPKAMNISSKFNQKSGVHQIISSNNQVNKMNKQAIKSVPKFKKTNTFINETSTCKMDFHDALLNEIRACGGRNALRKVNIHR